MDETPNKSFMFCNFRPLNIRLFYVTKDVKVLLVFVGLCRYDLSY